MNKIIYFLLLLIPGMILAQNGSGIGMAYMKIGVDARAAAMGDAYTTMADDASAAYWNPAGLAEASANSIVLMHNSWVQGINHEFAAVQLLNGRHNLAFSLNMMFVSGIELRGDRATDIPDGETSAQNVNLGVSYATELTAGWKIGGQLKYLYEKYYFESAGGYAIDIGVLKRDILPDLSWGAVIQNIGGMEKLKDESSRLPLSVRTGVSYHTPWTIFDNQPILAADIYYVHNDVTRLGLGMEAGIFENLALRAGYIFGSETLGVTAGLGVQFDRYNISYAFVPFQFDLGQSHRFSLAIDFD